ncbi:hypothetical protein FIBSPDRAFT_1043696 [Athelia psychrophila]|uniref:AIG1-type G domain-containing protein n=1 Tax=Athelia psychrophila TaxID=1759441 RepID=A0A166KSW4_9AGAM|nr:hypothetical protein FIBSPDRAFT_1043696 [Fibularhizoctonia sp. CBS 109695]
MTRYPTNSENDVPVTYSDFVAPSARAEPLNVIVCGSVGTGKSSLVNMLVGNDQAKTSDAASGCTLISTSYDSDKILSNGSTIKLWDTPGLNEADYTRFATINAIVGVYNLTRRMDGVSLLIYCVRGKINQAEVKTFKTIMAFCRDRVPIALVVTGLERVDDREAWWDRNVDYLLKEGLAFEGHACITSSMGDPLPGGSYRYEAEYKESDGSIRDMIRGSHLLRPWVAETQKEPDYLAARIYRGLLELLLRRPSLSAGSRDLYQAMKSNGFSQSVALLAAKEYDVSHK